MLPLQLSHETIVQSTKETSGKALALLSIHQTKFYFQNISAQPILMSHYPLYRLSDEHCDEPDGAPEDEKADKFREGWDCLTKNASQLLLDTLNPRLVLSGHTHHGKHRIK